MQSNRERLRSLDCILWERGFAFFKTEAVLLLKVVNLMAMWGMILISRRLVQGPKRDDEDQTQAVVQRKDSIKQKCSSEI